MKYIVYEKEIDSLKESEKIATRLGCNRQKEDMTKFWFATILLMQNNYALCINNDKYLTPLEKTALVDYVDKKIPYVPLKESIKMNGTIDGQKVASN